VEKQKLRRWEGEKVGKKQDWGWGDREVWKGECGRRKRIRYRNAEWGKRAESSKLKVGGRG
jgi:hypothetical protein